ncbi:MAG: hypothetical protein K8H86_12565 [Ignavibacteriaceae bacterium]|nr:hypothetical protein [Ignavibacteriaceae bacterium]
MKIIASIFLLFTTSIQAQKIVAYDMEILPQTQNFDNLEQVTFSITPVNTTAYCLEPLTGDRYIDANPMSGTQTITGNYLSPHGIPPGPVFDFGFDVCYSNSGYPKFNLTLNKIEINYNETSFIFYIDYRDYKYPYGIDVTIRYVKNDGVYYHSLLNVLTSYNDFTKINYGEFIRISEINNYPSTSTSCMNQLSFWQNCLVVIPTGNNNPRLVWAPHPSINLDNYIIYRAI